MSHPYLSVIVPAYNEEAVLGETLHFIKSALAQCSALENRWELIVCDNNSTDLTAEIASAEGARVVHESINQISRARNAGAAAAQGDWLLFVDADTHPSRELVQDAIEHARSGKVIGCGTTIQIEGGSKLNKLRLERLNPLYRLIQMSGGAFLLVETQAFRRVGGFSLELHALEEVDFLVRLKRLARERNQSFIVLTQHPVISSGRKDKLSVGTLLTLLVSNFVAVLYFLLYLLLPKRFLPKIPKSLLRYWYPHSRK